MRLLVLGPVELWDCAGRQVYLPRRQQRLILGLLGLEANHAVSIARLADLIWGERPPPVPLRVIQSRVSELRSLLAAAAGGAGSAELVHADGGYVLRTDLDAVDAHRFRRLVADARAHAADDAAVALLRSALDLWRGPVLGGPLAGFSYPALCRGLESQRRGAAEDLFEIELRLGRHHWVIGDLLDAVTVFPGDDRLNGQLMRALYGSGRAVEALQVYDAYRRWLGDELGIDPSAELQALHLKILRGDAGASRPGVPAARQPRSLS
jgi:DNA-binding SARP family transcriptional activator